jgi:lysophospholipase L1-like esterase
MTSPSLPPPSNSFGKRHVLAIVFVAIVYILSQHPRDNPLTPTRDQERSTDPLLIAAPNPLLCQDDDDFQVTHCSCRDPAVAYMYKRQLWRTHHQRMKQVAADAPSHLDVVFLGDSIFERLNGTRMNGHQPAYLANKRVFDQYFQTERMKGLILGSSGDTTGHFLWHLQNGLLPESLQPKAFVILLGTNNMGRDGCNKRTTLAGILQVIHVVHRQKPDAMILVHGLLPCSDQKPFRGPDYNELENRFTLGKQWENSLWINAELKKTCDLMKFCAYMDSGDVFLTPDGRIQDDRIVDSMHPSLEGYKMWVPRIAGRLELLLKGKSRIRVR